MPFQPDRLLIRPAAPADLAAINAIYNHYVLCSTCTFQLEPEPEADRRAWFERHDPQHPVLVAVRDGAVLGWGSLSAFHPRAAYAHTVEDSVYVRHDCQRQGIGRALLRALLSRAQAIGHHTVLASIAAPQTPSIALHAQFGFVETAHLLQVGFKFGRWIDVVYLQVMLGSEKSVRQ